MPHISLGEALDHIRSDVSGLLAVEPIQLGMADPPDATGVYMLLVNNEIVYVGEAKGSQGLRDRLLRKHISGDDNHACQRAFKEQLPDRLKRREHIRNNVLVRWLAISDSERVSAVERLLIWIYKPAWNRK